MESEVGKRAHNIKVENKTWSSHIADYELEEKLYRIVDGGRRYY